MKKSISILSVALMALFTMSFTSSPVQNWEKLGSRKVNFGLDKDVIQVRAHKGGFAKLKVQVSGSGLNMHKMTVHYGNGSSQNIQLRHNFSKNSGSKVIDLTGGKRIIKKVTFWYDTKNIRKRKAAIHLFGRH